MKATTVQLTVFLNPNSREYGFGDEPKNMFDNFKTWNTKELTVEVRDESTDTLLNVAFDAGNGFYDLPFTATRTRSVSVGDVIELPNGTTHIVENIGFKELSLS